MNRTQHSSGDSTEWEEVGRWRRHLHERPELLYETHETAAFVAARLTEFGCDRVETGIGRTGVVGLIEGRQGTGRAVALRADMDALPIEEQTGLPYASRSPGRMHACGHDGHTAMLLGAARKLAATRDFAGTVAVIFQPAEEGGAGAKAMIEDGLFERFPADSVFAIHNLPGMAVGDFGTCAGPIMASTDEFAVDMEGRGGHAAMPELTADPILAGAALVQALQQIVSRNTDPLDSVVVSVTQFHAGFAKNVIPETGRVSGTVRSLREETRVFAEARIREIAAAIGTAHGVRLTASYSRNYPVTRNHAAEARFAAEAAASLAGADKVNANLRPTMGGEDFSYMLEARPGAFLFTGNGSTAGLHHPRYDFNDEAIPHGVAFWMELTRRALAA